MNEQTAWVVEVLDASDGALVKGFGPYVSHDRAERISGKLKINLDHKRFNVVIRTAHAAQENHNEA